MKIHFFSDPHMGVERRANTTSSSRKALKQEIISQLKTILGAGHLSICLGDLFDTYRVPEETMLEAYWQFQNIYFTLAGNHDVINDRDAVGSLQFFSEALPAKVVSLPYGTSGFVPTEIGGAWIYSIPHTTTQALFEESLQAAYDSAQVLTENGEKDKPRILLLHCNMNRPEEFLSETELNLTVQDAVALSECFDHVLLGHEHNPVDYPNNVTVLGNVFPTSFSDISDKRTLIFDTETGEMESEVHWQKDDHYLEVNWKALPDTLAGIQFLDLTGKVTSDEVFEISETVRLAWKNGPDLLAVRDSTEAEGMFHVEQASEVGVKSETFGDFITSRLQGSDIAEVFEEVKRAAQR